MATVSQLLESLTACTGVSGLETSASQTAADILMEYGEVRVDPMHNVIGRIAGKGPHILLDAHIDQIGLIVTGIEEQGFLRVSKCGGVDARILLGHEVTVWGSEPLLGVICCQPPHLTTAESYKSAPKIEEIGIDIGFSKQEAEKRVHLGDRISLRRRPVKLLGNRWSGPSFDDRAGVVSLLRTLELLREKGVSPNLTVLFSSQEEVGTRGAGAASFGIHPEQAIAVDVSFAMTPDSPRNQCGDLGKGPMIGIAPSLDYKLSRELEELAQKEDIPYQLEIMNGETGTNADVIGANESGTRMGLVSIPLRYMHTGIEVIEEADIENTARLLAAHLSGLAGEKNV